MSTSETRSHHRRTLPADLGAHHTRGGPYLGEQRLGDGQDVPQPPASVRRAVLLDAAEDLCSLRSPKPLSPRIRWSRQASLQLLDAPHSEGLVQGGGLLRPEVGQAQQLEDAGRELGPELLQELEAPGPVELGDLLRQGRSDVGQLGETALAHQGVQVAAEAGHPVCAEVVGA